MLMRATLLMMAERQSARSKGDEGRGRKNERWDLQRLRTRTFLSSRHSPENAEAKQTRSRLTDGVFTCYLPQLVFFAFSSACARACVCVRERAAGTTHLRLEGVCVCVCWGPASRLRNRVSSELHLRDVEGRFSKGK